MRARGAAESDCGPSAFCLGYNKTGVSRQHDTPAGGPKPNFEMAAVRGFLDVDRAVVCRAIPHFGLASRPGCDVETGDQLCAGGLVRVCGAVDSGGSAGAQVSFCG